VKYRPSGGAQGPLLSVGTSPCGSRTYGYAHSPLRGVCPLGTEIAGLGDLRARIPIGKCSGLWDRYAPHTSRVRIVAMRWKTNYTSGEYKDTSAYLLIQHPGGMPSHSPGSQTPGNLPYHKPTRPWRGRIHTLLKKQAHRNGNIGEENNLQSCADSRRFLLDGLVAANPVLKIIIFDEGCLLV